MTTYNIALEGNLLEIGFGEPATNEQIVKDAKLSSTMVTQGIYGQDLFINGRASLPVAFVLAEEFQHIAKSLNVFDPKLGGYVRTVAKGQQIGGLYAATGEEIESPDEVEGEIFQISLEDNLLSVGFGAPAQNTQIVKFVHARLGELNLGGKLLKVSGACSLPASFAIASKVAGLYGSVAVFDPKLEAFVVAISHNPEIAVGDLIV